jgi:hypothetical protein
MHIRIIAAFCTRLHSLATASLLKQIAVSVRPAMQFLALATLHCCWVYATQPAALCPSSVATSVFDAVFGQLAGPVCTRYRVETALFDVDVVAMSAARLVEWRTSSFFTGQAGTAVECGVPNRREGLERAERDLYICESVGDHLLGVISWHGTVYVDSGVCRYRGFRVRRVGNIVNVGAGGEQ